MSWEAITSREGLEITLALDYEVGLPSRVLTDMVSIVEAACYRVVRDDFASVAALAARELNLNESVFWDRLQRANGNATVLRSVKQGSAILEFSYSNIATWVIVTTLAEPAREAFKQTGTYKKIVELLQTDLSSKARKMLALVKRRANANGFLRPLLREKRLTIVEDSEDAQRIRIAVDTIGYDVVESVDERLEG
jgi:hypothetical protein